MGMSKVALFLIVLQNWFLIIAAYDPPPLLVLSSIFICWHRFVPAGRQANGKQQTWHAAGAKPTKNGETCKRAKIHRCQPKTISCSPLCFPFFFSCFLLITTVSVYDWHITYLYTRLWCLPPGVQHWGEPSAEKPNHKHVYAKQREPF